MSTEPRHSYNSGRGWHRRNKTLRRLGLVTAGVVALAAIGGATAIVVNHKPASPDFSTATAVSDDDHQLAVQTRTQFAKLYECQKLPPMSELTMADLVPAVSVVGVIPFDERQDIYVVHENPHIHFLTNELGPTELGWEPLRPFRQLSWEFTGSTEYYGTFYKGPDGNWHAAETTKGADGNIKLDLYPAYGYDKTMFLIIGVDPTCTGPRVNVESGYGLSWAALAATRENGPDHNLA